jgi:hypothetical protein
VCKEEEREEVMAYIVDDLPPQGTMMLYRMEKGRVFHRSIIDSGMIITMCGKHIQLAVRKPQIPGMKISDPNKDELFASPGLRKVIEDNYPICGRCW